MSTHLLAVIVGIPLAWLVGMAAYAYHDAGRRGMDPRKWALVSLAVPLFGFFAYLFEREERDYDPGEDPFAGGGYDFHESREGDARLGGDGETDGRSFGNGGSDRRE